MHNLRPTIKIRPIVDSIKILNISDKEYFSSTFSNYISNSRLKLINPDEGGSPELFKNGITSEYSPSFEIGSAVHELILQPDDFLMVTSIDKPTGKLGVVCDYLYEKAYSKDKDVDSFIEKATEKADYYKGKITENRKAKIIEAGKPYWEKRKAFEDTCLESKELIYLDFKSQEKVNSCIEKVKENEHIQKILNPLDLFDEKGESYNEYCILVDIVVSLNGKEVPLKLKGKLDNFTICDSVVTLNDLKTTGKPIDSFGRESFVKYHYARQMAMYNYMLNLVCKYHYKMKDYILDKPNMLLINTIPPFYSGVFTLTENHLKEGFEEFKKLITYVAICELYGYDKNNIINFFKYGEL